MAVQQNPGIDFAQAQKGYHDIAAARRQARESMTDALKTKASKDFARTKGMSEAVAIQRAKGLAMVEAELHAKAAVAQVTLERDMADAEARSAAMRIGELEGERASLRQLIDWTREESGS